METEVIPPVVLKLAPEILAREIVTAAVPVFVSVSVCERFEPVVTFPKLKLVALTASAGEAAPFELVFPGFPALVKPTHPEMVKVMSSVASAANKANWLCRFGSPVATV